MRPEVPLTLKQQVMVGAILAALVALALILVLWVRTVYIPSQIEATPVPDVFTYAGHETWRCSSPVIAPSPSHHLWCPSSEVFPQRPTTGRGVEPDVKQVVVETDRKAVDSVQRHAGAGWPAAQGATQALPGMPSAVEPLVFEP